MGSRYIFIFSLLFGYHIQSTGDELSIFEEKKANVQQQLEDIFWRDAECEEIYKALYNKFKFYDTAANHEYIELALNGKADALWIKRIPSEKVAYAMLFIAKKRGMIIQSGVKTMVSYINELYQSYFQQKDDSHRNKK